MVELILLLGLFWVLRNWLLVPTDQDCDDWIVMDEFTFTNESDGD